jgi:hypothetical protein
MPIAETNYATQNFWPSEFQLRNDWNLPKSRPWLENLWQKQKTSTCKLRSSL